MFLKTIAMLMGIVMILYIATRNTYLLATKETTARTRLADTLLILAVWFFTIILTIVVLGDIIVQMSNSDDDLYVAALMITACALGVLGGYESGSGKDMTHVSNALCAFGCFAAVMCFIKLVEYSLANGVMPIS